jgi:hypothetical protein
MRLWIAILIAGATLAGAGRAEACENPDLDEVASDGRVVYAFPFVAVVGDAVFDDHGYAYAVPARPSFYFHPGKDGWETLPTFTRKDGTPIPYLPVLTGMSQFPLRFDLAIESGTIIDTKRRWVRYEVDPEMAPHSYVKAEWWNDYLKVGIDSDAALLRVETDDKTWVQSSSEGLFFQSLYIRVTAIYANRTEEVIFEHGVRPSASEAPVPPVASIHALVVLAMLGVLGVVGMMGMILLGFDRRAIL